VAENLPELFLELIVVLAKLLAEWGKASAFLASIFVSMLTLNPRLNAIELALRSYVCVRRPRMGAF